MPDARTEGETHPLLVSQPPAGARAAELTPERARQVVLRAAAALDAQADRTTLSDIAQAQMRLDAAVARAFAAQLDTLFSHSRRAGRLAAVLRDASGALDPYHTGPDMNDSIFDCGCTLHRRIRAALTEDGGAAQAQPGEHYVTDTSSDYWPPDIADRLGEMRRWMIEEQGMDQWNFNPRQLAYAIRAITYLRQALIQFAWRLQDMARRAVETAEGYCPFGHTSPCDCPGSRWPEGSRIGRTDTEASQDA